MKKILVTLAVVAMAPLLAAPAAEAGVFSVGVAFSVGGFYFDLGFGGPRYGAHVSHHVYRVSEPFHYRGYSCHSGCYRTGGYSYHHADCPAVAYHFRSYGFSPYSSYPAFFAAPGNPYSGPYRYDRHRGHLHYRGYGGFYHRGWSGRADRYYHRGYRDRSQRHYRYDRRYDRRHDRRYDRRHDRRYDRRHDLRDRRHHRGRDGVREFDRRHHRPERMRGDRGRDLRGRDAASTRSRDLRSRPSDRGRGDRGRRPR